MFVIFGPTPIMAVKVDFVQYSYFVVERCNGVREVVNYDFSSYNRSSACFKGDVPAATGCHSIEMFVPFSPGEQPVSLQLDGRIT